MKFTTVLTLLGFQNLKRTQKVLTTIHIELFTMDSLIIKQTDLEQKRNSLTLPIIFLALFQGVLVSRKGIKTKVLASHLILVEPFVYTKKKYILFFDKSWL